MGLFKDDKEVMDKQQEDGEEPKTLWDMFMQYMKNKEKSQDKKFVEAI